MRQDDDLWIPQLGSRARDYYTDVELNTEQGL